MVDRHSGLTALAATIVTLCCQTPAQAQKAVYLVRHAEKAGDGLDDPLTDAGKVRAGALARLLETAGVRAIYTSEFRRTRDTAAPLAAKLGITPVAKPADDPDATFQDVVAHHACEVVLIVGHTTTVPALLKKWSPGADVGALGETEFDKVFVVVPAGSGAAGWTRFRYP